VIAVCHESSKMVFQMSRESDRQLQRTLDILEDVLISMRNLDKMFPPGTPERAAVDSAFHHLDRSIELIEVAEADLSDHVGPVLEVSQMEGPPTRIPPWTFRIDAGGWISANEKSLTCLRPVRFKCSSFHSPSRRTLTWKCKVSSGDGLTELIVGMGSTRDRALRHAVLKIRSALGDPLEPTQDTFKADPFLLGDYFERS